MSDWPHTGASFSRLQPTIRGYLAQVLLSWALKMDGRAVMETVYDGIVIGTARRGKTAEDWRAASAQLK